MDKIEAISVCPFCKKSNFGLHRIGKEDDGIVFTTCCNKKIEEVDDDIEFNDDFLDKLN